MRSGDSRGFELEGHVVGAVSKFLGGPVRHLIATLAIGGAVVCAVGVLLAQELERPTGGGPTAAAAWQYICLFGLAISAASLAHAAFNRAAATAAVGAFGLIAILGWLAIDTYPRVALRGEMWIQDQVYILSGRVKERRAKVYESPRIAREDRGGIRYDFELIGPLSASGRPHGRWTQNVGPALTREAMTDGSPLTQDVYLWYGEEVSEGEWMLRNGRQANH